MLMSLNSIHCKQTLSWGINKNPNKKNVIFFFKPSITKSKPINAVSSLFSPSPSSSSKHTTLLVETYHDHDSLRALIQRLKSNSSSPLQVLQQDGDWSKEHFWAVINFLRRNPSTSIHIPQVFDMWKNIEKSRINEPNYERIIVLLGQEGLIEEAVNALKEMKGLGLKPSLQVYNSIVHGYSRNGKFDKALCYLEEMKEFGLVVDTSTYFGLIEAYGKHEMYDEISMCIKKMKLDGVRPDHLTYNLLIREFARGGLIESMERVYKRLILKRMHLQFSTLSAMLEVYMKFGLIEKMEKCYRKLSDSKYPLKEDMVRRVAEVYIKSYMFSRLGELGDDVASKTGTRSELVWCLRLLSHACSLSRRGMESVVNEMEEARVSWSVSVVNIILLACLKMDDFKRLKVVLSESLRRRVKPDIVTVGVVYDASRFGFDETVTVEMWRRVGLLYESVKMETDPLVLAAYGKGQFLKACEEAFLSMEPNLREKRWSYQDLIDLVVKRGEK